MDGAARLPDQQMDLVMNDNDYREPDWETVRLNLMRDPTTGWWIWPLLFVFVVILPLLALLISLDAHP